MTATTRYSIVIALVLSGGIAAPALAQSVVPPDRANAIHDCWSMTLKKYPWKASDLNNSAQQLNTYANCMHEHRQPS
jgi:hypothetical protein